MRVYTVRLGELTPTVSGLGFEGIEVVLKTAADAEIRKAKVQAFTDSSNAVVMAVSAERERIVSKLRSFHLEHQSEGYLLPGWVTAEIMSEERQEIEPLFEEGGFGSTPTAELAFKTANKLNEVIEYLKKEKNK